MNSKMHVFFVITIAAILFVSVITAGGIQYAIADKDDDDNDDKQKKPKFHKKPSFESKDCIITSFAEEFLPQENFEKLDCKMTAWLDKKGNALKYKIQVTGMELIDSNTHHPHYEEGAADDIDGAHIHKMTHSDENGLKGPHVLDVFGNPQFGDSDVVVKPIQGIVKGIWDDGDVPTKLSDNLDLFCEGKIFTAVHGELEDDKENNPGHKAPYVKMALEPTKQGNKICDKLRY